MNTHWGCEVCERRPLALDQPKNFVTTSSTKPVHLLLETVSEGPDGSHMTPAGGFDRAAFAARLSAVLADAASTIRDIEDATNISRTTLAAWKAGKRSPHLDHLAALTAFLEVDLAWVLFGHPSADETRRALDELRQGVEKLGTALVQIAADAEALVEQ